MIELSTLYNVKIIDIGLGPLNALSALGRRGWVAVRRSLRSSAHHAVVYSGSVSSAIRRTEVIVPSMGHVPRISAGYHRGRVHVTSGGSSKYVALTPCSNGIMASHHTLFCGSAATDAWISCPTGDAMWGGSPGLYVYNRKHLLWRWYDTLCNVVNCAFSPDGQYLAVINGPSTYMIIKVDSGRVVDVKSLSTNEVFFWSVAWTTTSVVFAGNAVVVVTPGSPPRINNSLPASLMELVVTDCGMAMGPSDRGTLVAVDTRTLDILFECKLDGQKITHIARVPDRSHQLLLATSVGTIIRLHGVVHYDLLAYDKTIDALNKACPDSLDSGMLRHLSALRLFLEQRYCPPTTNLVDIKRRPTRGKEGKGVG